MSINFGPWADGIDVAERVARLRALRAFAMVWARPQQDFISALARAESDPAALATAAALLNEIPALPRRRMLASYGALSNNGGPTWAK
jgi:hypothetical protein